LAVSFATAIELLMAVRADPGVDGGEVLRYRNYVR
jgi:hypothetical protein